MTTGLKSFIAAVSISAVVVLLYLTSGHIHQGSKKSLSLNPKLAPAAHLGSVEAVPSKVTDKQAISLDHISAVSDAEMLGLVGNMSPEQRLIVAKRLTEKLGNLAKIAGFFKAWSAIDGLAAFRASQEFLNPSQREVAMTAVFEGADAKTAENLVNQLGTLKQGAINAEVAQELLNIGLSKWSTIDSKGAAIFLQTYGQGIRGDIFQTVGENLAKQNGIQEALAWKDAQPEGVQAYVMQGIMTTWLANNQAEAIAYARQDAGLLVGVTNALAATDPAAAKSLVESLPVQDQAGMAYSAAIKLAHDDPAGAAAWVATLPPEARTTASGAVATQYAIQDPATGLAWINSLSGITRDTAMSAYAIGLRDPGMGLSNAFTITDNTLRANTVNSIANHWQAVDPTGLIGWVKASGLPPETQAALIPGQ